MRYTAPAPGRGRESEFGRQLRRVRVERKLTQRDLTGPGVSESYISRLENGSRVPSPDVVRVLAERLGVAPHVLTGTPGPGGDEAAGLVWCHAMLLLLDGEPAAAAALLTGDTGEPGAGIPGGALQVLLPAALTAAGAPAVALATAGSALAEVRGTAAHHAVEVFRAELLRELDRCGEAVRACLPAANSSGPAWLVARARLVAAESCADSGDVAGAAHHLAWRGAASNGLRERALRLRRDVVRARVLNRTGYQVEAADLLADAAARLAVLPRALRAGRDVHIARAEVAADGEALAPAQLEELLAPLRDGVTATRRERVVGLLLRAELALGRGDQAGCAAFAGAIMAEDGALARDRVSAGLLLVKSAEGSGARAAVDGLRVLVDRDAPAAVDTDLWRRIARVALDRD